MNLDNILDSEEGYVLDEEDDIFEENSESDDEEADDEPRLRNEAEIEHFNAILLEAQAMAVKAEHEAAGKKPKRKRHNTGNSNRTKRRHTQNRRELTSAGQKLISSMFPKEKKELTTQSCAAPVEKMDPDIIEIDHDSDSSDDEDDEIEISLKRLFPGKLDTSIPATEDPGPHQVFGAF